MAATQQVRLSSHKEIAGGLLNLKDRAAADVGCGEGAFSLLLARGGADVTGIDVNEARLARAAEKARAEGLSITWRKARAEAMPFDDESLDLVAFSNSLHHIAPERIADALGEARRVLKPGGILYVMEPVAAGPWFEATRLFNDESAVRTRALDEVRALEGHGFTPVAEITYAMARVIDSYEDWAADQSAQSDGRRRAFSERGEEIRARVLAAARREDGGLRFEQMFRVNCLRKTA